MLSVSKSLLGRIKRPLIVNGKVLRYQGEPVLAYLVDYHTVYVTQRGNSIPRTAGDQLLISRLESFEKKYGSLVSGEPYEATAETTVQEVDTFTGAILISSPTFKELSNPEVHSLDRQHTESVHTMLRSFMCEYITDYFEIFTLYMNRKLTAQYMPVKIKSHFVAGLFQPIIVDTELIPSPLRFDECAWFRDILRDNEINLDADGNSSRRVNITCIATCDLCEYFRCDIAKQVSAREWLFIMFAVISSEIDRSSTAAFSQRWNSVFSTIAASKAKSALMSATINTVTRSRRSVTI